MKSRKCRILVICLFFATLAVSDGGVASKVLIIGGKQVGKELLEKGAKEVAEQTAKKTAKKIAQRYGDNVVMASRRVSSQLNIPEEDIARELLKHGDSVYKKAGFADDALVFGIRNGPAGRFLLKRTDDFGYQYLKNTGWMKPEAKKAVEEAWKLADPGFNPKLGSWQRLRAAMTKAGINQGDRDFCERLFLNRAKAGRIPGIPKGTKIIDGHLGDVRQGIDALAVDAKSGKLRVIEFGTGKKPALDNPNQMTPAWVRERLAELVKDSNKRIELRDAGCPLELTFPEKVLDSKFPLDNYITREFFSPDIDQKLCAKIGATFTKLQ